MTCQKSDEVIDAVFSKGGLLNRAIEGFAPRIGQGELAQRINQAIGLSQNLVAEAGTGTGKTFAYLVPALYAEKKTIISTGTKNLQDQLYSRDLPRLLKVLKKPIKTALLKGRANYICHHRLNLHESQGEFPDRETLKDFIAIKNALPRLKTGDIAELEDIPEQAKVWPWVTSTTDNCLGTECDYYEECFLAKARKKAQSADLVVINHHLFFADCALKEDGFAEILPTAQVVIFDEAHQLPDIAANFFGRRLSSRQLRILTTELTRELENIAKDDRVLAECLLLLQDYNDEFRLCLGDEIQRLAWFEISKKNSVMSALENLIGAITKLEEALITITGRSQVFEKSLERVTQHKNLLLEVQSLPSTNSVYWLETFKRSYSLYITPLSVADDFQLALRKKTSYIFTSATLTVNESFDYFCNRLGLEQVETVIFESPFDFEQQSLLYMPRGLPDPNDKDYNWRVVDSITWVLEEFKGRTFCLFTSFRALNMAYDYLSRSVDFPLLMQGSMSKSLLIEKFVNTEGAVLLGTYSFWEGVDVKGSALSCVIIDKLPFESPGCPIVRARSDRLKKQGLSPFYDYQIPQAVISLKQGLGRLLRDVDDKGVMVVCDPRLYGRAYGEVFMHSLPPVKKTRDKQFVLEFIDSILP